MRFTYARFKGYIGFNNGMGLHELEIDFSKAFHKVCIISGKNGCGKSTLLDSLTLMPDSSSSFTPGMSAEKELHIFDNGDIYIVLIQSPITSSGSRATSKAYIQKNGVELNTNGNIGSYKDIIATEFDLDANYIALSKLSISNKGLVGKSPAERKKFFSNIISCLDTYNSMNKVFTKKSNIFKSYINNTSSKIKNIGDEEVLRSSMVNITNRMKELNLIHAQLEKDITEADSYIKIVDPNGLIQEQYNQIYTEMLSCKKTLEQIDGEFQRSLDIIGEDDDKLDELKESLSKNIFTLESDNKNAQSKLVDLLDQKEEDLHVLEIKKQKIDNIKGGFNIDELKETVQTLRNTILNQENIFKISGITNFDVSRDEYIFIFSNMRKIKHMIDVFKNKNISIIQATCKTIESNSEEIHIRQLESLYNEESNLKLELSQIENDIKYLKRDIATMSILSERPSNCKIDTCPLIENALNIRGTEPEKQIEEKSARIEDIKNRLSQIDDEIINGEDIEKSVKELNQIIEVISSNNLLDKLPTSVILRDRNEFLSRIYNSNTFNEIEDSDIYIERAEEIEDYRENKELLVKLEANLTVIENKESLINELISEVESIEQKLENCVDLSANLTRSIQFNENVITDYKKKLEMIKNLIEMKNNRDEIQERKETLFSQYQEIKSNLEQIKNYLDKINYSNDELMKIENELLPLQDQNKMIEHSLISLEEYKAEYGKYKEKYDIIDKLKKYSSPSSEGIQTLFINIYMAKTLSMCNELLSMLFNGEYQLLEYVINSQEFRMPFIGNGMEVDDISSGSSSQVAMMGMIVNFVLLFQASTKYNIVGCDELDEVLDTLNRLQYIQVLYKVIEILGIDQCIIISHSSEIDRSNMDVIQLAEYNKTDCYGDGNIIYNFYDTIS